MPKGKNGARAASHPTCSVVITTYNRLELLKRALAGVYRQTFRDFEIVVADAGNDGTTPYLKGLKLPLRLVSLPHNPGVAALMNAGLRLSRGRFVVFLESDDYWRPEFLAVMLDAFKNKKIKCASSAWWNLNADGDAVCRYHWRDAAILIPDIAGVRCMKSGARFHWPWHLSFTLFKREVFDEIGAFDPGLKWEAVDVDFYARMTLAYGAKAFLRLDEPLGFWTGHYSSLQLTNLSCQSAMQALPRIAGIGRPRDPKENDFLLDRAYFVWKYSANWREVERKLPFSGDRRTFTYLN